MFAAGVFHPPHKRLAMSNRFTEFRAGWSEDACLGAMMAARHGGAAATCPACGRRGAFVPRPKLRGCACESCNHLVFPCAGTPLEARRISLQHWFFAIRLVAADGPKRARAALAGEAGLATDPARRMVEELAALDKAGAPVWLATIRRSVSDAAGGLAQGKVDVTGQAPGSDASPVAGGSPAFSRPAVIAAVALAVVAGLGAIAAVVLMPRGEPAPEPVQAEAPALQSAPARPSLILSSIEDDLEAARQATLFAVRNDPSLATIPEALPQTPAPQAMPPPNILIAPQRIAPTILGPGQTRPPAGPAGPGPVASGDPDQILTFGPIKIRRHLVDTIVRAGRVAGADPTLLMAIADKESSFSTGVKAKTSSATGLYQFIEQTWLGVIFEFGGRYGMANEVRSIARSGRQFVVGDSAERERILDLRREPYISALLAAEMLKRDTLRLEKAMGRHLSGGEIYLIHFLGPDAAQTFIATMEETPGASAAELLPRPAQANRPIFYAEADGQTKTLSVSEVHRKFNDMIKLRLDRYGAVRRLGPPGQAPLKR